MEQQLFALLGVSAVGMSAIVTILHRQRATRASAIESPFAISTEGETRCPKCGMGNSWTERCIGCGRRLGA
jgi:DNA-binding transcriptional regulator YdaS (Cro superfamily)